MSLSNELVTFESPSTATVPTALLNREASSYGFVEVIRVAGRYLHLQDPASCGCDDLISFAHNKMPSCTIMNE